MLRHKQSEGRIIFLTGAPLSSSLDWREASLCCPLQKCFEERKTIGTIVSSSEKAFPLWRSLPLEAKHLPSGLTQLIHTGDDAERETQRGSEGTSFLNVTEISIFSDASEDQISQDPRSSGSTSDDALTQFYEHSYAMHEEIPTSNVISLDFIEDKSLSSVSAIDGEHTELQRPEQLMSKIAHTTPRSFNATSLMNIPDAAVIRGLGASTMSVDLIVGVLSISAPRLIRTKKYGRSVELVEMIVADDAKAGFGITIWLPIPKERCAKAPPEDVLRSSVTKLRPRDIILARNVALDSFKGKVYGQSLRKGITKLDLLYRNAVDSQDESGAYTWEELNIGIKDPQLVRVRAVKDWLMFFVGPEQKPPHSDRQRKDHVTRQGRPQLPADTQ